MFGKNKKASNYDEVVTLYKQVSSDPEWEIVHDGPGYVYGGGSSDDIDYVTTYYNSKLERAIRFIINYTYKTAMLQNVPLKELDINNLDTKKRK